MALKNTQEEKLSHLSIFLDCLQVPIVTRQESDYALMPPLFHLDSFEECFDEPDAIYCFGEFVLLSDEPNKLLNLIQEFSKQIRRFNHTILRHGYCMKKTCNKFYNVSGSDQDLRLSLEACTNETIYNKYKLETRLTEDIDCSKRDRDQPIDYLDIYVGLVCVLIIIANFIGSLCDHYLEKGKDRGGLRFLYCFSIFRNWKKFVAPAGEGRDPRFKALRGIHGIRSINIVMVVIAHSFYCGIILLVNPELVEQWYEVKFFSIFMNGPLIMQSYFIVSSFLLVYNWLIFSETHALSWTMLPMQIIMRWLRLTPSYALILGLTTTWFARLTSGPFWMKLIYYEVRDCRQDWWKHLLYINNYTKRTNCMPQTWYLAADTQLYIFAVVVFLICRTNLTRKVVLSLLFAIGIIAPVLHTYYQGLNGILISSPDKALNLFKEDPTFNQVYMRAHTNLTGCIIGMALGYIIYNWQKAGGDPKKFQKYRYPYWSLLFFGVLVCFSGHIFFADGPPLPVYVHLLYAALLKPVFGIVIATIIGGVIIQFEGVYRPILEWRPFTFIARLSFSAYLVHTAFIRTEVASITTLHRTSIISVTLKSLTLTMGTFIAAFFFLLMVENPFSNLVGAIFRKPDTHEQNKDAVKEKKIEEKNGVDMSQTQTEDGTIVIKMESRM